MKEKELERYRYYYKIALTPVSNKEVDFEQDTLDGSALLSASSRSVKEYLTDKLHEYSEKSKNSVYNAKEIDFSTLCITKRAITFTLCSMEELPILGRSMRFFSQLVLEEKYFQDLLVQKKLFKTFLPAESKNQDQESKITDISSVSDTELVKSLVEILPLPEYTIKKEVRTAVEQMKVLAVESGLLSPHKTEKPLL